MKIKEIFTDFYSGMFFNHIPLFRGDSQNPNESVVNLSILYINRSGNKVASPLLESEYSKFDITEVEERVGSILFSLYNNKWQKSLEALHMEYDPLKSYEYNETETPDITITGTNNRTSKEVVAGTNVNERDFSTVDNLSVYGYNSTSPEPKDKNTTSDTGTGTETINRTNDDTENGNFSRTESGTRTIHKDGTTWVHTRQRLLKEEMQLREYDIYEVIFRDIDKILTCPMY